MGVKTYTIVTSEIPVFSYPFADDAIQPLRILTLDHPPTYDYPEAHRHNYYEIFMFISGSGKHLIDFTEHPIAPETIHLVSPGQVHRVKRSRNSTAIIFIFSPDFLDRLSIPFDVPQGWASYPVLNPGSHEFAELMNMARLLNSESAGGTNAEGITLSLMQAFLLKLNALVPKTQPENPTPGFRHLTNFRKLLDQNFKIWHFPSDYAAALNLTEKHLNEVIKEQCNKSVGLMIRERVLLEARRLLFNTDWNAKEISYHLNFSDPAYFNRFFKRMTGVTPNAFRQQSRKKYNF